MDWQTKQRFLDLEDAIVVLSEKLEALGRQVYELSAKRVAKLEAAAESEALPGVNVSHDPDGSAAATLDTCPSCGGPADKGHDREVPPSAYNCSKCSKA